jgi:predicted nucleotidyltransferase
MTNAPDHYLERIKKLVLDALESYPVTVYLFGSFSRGDTHALSDIDIAVEPLGPLPSGVLPRLREALEESTIPRTIEIIDLRDADPEFSDRIRKEGVIWSASTNA